MPLAVLGGALRVSTPFVFVSLGECLTEKSGRVNLGLEGTLVMGAMSGYGVSYLSGSAWLGVLAAGLTGLLLGPLHGWLCGRPKVNDIAVGIALMLLGVGLAFFLGKPLIKPTAPRLPALPLGVWSDRAEVQAALQVNVLLLIGVVAGLRAAAAAPPHPLGAGAAGGGRERRRRPGAGLRRGPRAPAGHRRRAGSSPAWAARSCRCITRAAGTRGCRAARG